MILKALFVFGTRPEAIKMAPLILGFAKEKSWIDLKVCVTGQHKEMLDQVMDFFDLKADYNLAVMKPNQNLFDLSGRILLKMQTILEEFQPHLVFVHGDTTTSTFAALSAFYHRTKIAHIEAGLRTFNKWAPFPEEMNRSLTGRLADYHFAPTDQSKRNLLAENIPAEQICVTGNTVIDALYISVQKANKSKNPEIEKLKSILDFSKKIILVTGHRRENFGDGFLQICKGLKQLAKHEEVEIVYPVHLNPNVQKPVYELLEDTPNIHLIEPLAYEVFVWLMDKSYFVITDSGGIQEEAPSLGKPVLVMRETTERPEAVEAGTVVLVGTDAQEIETWGFDLLNNTELYEKMSRAHNPYGDGFATQRILDFLKDLVNKGKFE